MSKFALLILLAAMISLGGCGKKEHSISFKGPSGETTSVTVTE